MTPPCVATLTRAVTTSTTSISSACLSDDETALMMAGVDGRHGCLDGADAEELEALSFAQLARSYSNE
jgi:hypothetical protein